MIDDEKVLPPLRHCVAPALRQRRMGNSPPKIGGAGGGMTAGHALSHTLQSLSRLLPYLRGAAAAPWFNPTHFTLET